MRSLEVQKMWVVKVAVIPGKELPKKICAEAVVVADRAVVQSGSKKKSRLSSKSCS